MKQNLAVVGLGVSGFSAISPGLSYREMVYDAAVKAYSDAGLEHTQIEAFVTTAEDFQEGYSIADEYSPDQIGGALKPCYTVPGDFLHTFGAGVMMIQTGVFDIVAVQCMSKASNMITLPDLTTFAMDPAINRPLKFSEHVIAGLEMSHYLFESGNTLEQCAAVVVKNKANALLNPHADFGAQVTIEAVLDSEPVAYPVSRLNVPMNADGAVVAVLVSEKALKGLSGTPVFIKGVGWSTDAPSLESRDWDRATYAYDAAAMAFKQAGITCAANQLDLAEVSDEYGYKELMHIEALSLCQRGAAGEMIQAGFFSRGGDVPVNLSGGTLGVGNLYDANGGVMLVELVTQLRAEAGKRQVKDAKTGAALSWRGVPSSSGAAIVLTNEG